MKIKLPNIFIQTNIILYLPTLLFSTTETRGGSICLLKDIYNTRGHNESHTKSDVLSESVRKRVPD